MSQDETREQEAATVATENLPEPVPVVHPALPLRNTVVFPGQVVPLTVGRTASLEAVEAAIKDEIPLVLVTQRDGQVEDPSPDDIYEWGCAVQVLKPLHMPDGSRTVIVQGVSRVRIVGYERTRPHLAVRVRFVDEPLAEGVRVDALEQSLKETYQKFAELAPYLSGEHVVMVHNAEPAGRLADLITSTLQIDVAEKYALLETLDIEERLERVNRVLTRELQIHELSSKIQSEVRGELSKSQREYFLREQLRAIRRELGEEEADETDRLRERIEQSAMSPEARKAAESELERLARVNPASPEYGVSRTYLDWLLDIPWTTTTEDRVDLAAAREILDRDHHGLEKVKKRILEYLAVRKLKPDLKGPILCFVGPPGVGKTSLGRSIAEALGRDFVRISLGGVRDEAEIRGHRRTYIGSRPGRIVTSLKKAKTLNPVFILDEIDKLRTDFHGDPSAALLEVLDPEQNGTFSDHYLEVPYDLSKVLFIATANWTDPIPSPLRDRMEIIEIPGYTTEEKLRIAERYLVPRQIDAHGLKKNQIAVNKNALESIIVGYTREAGVRNLERTIANVVRGVAREVVEGRNEKRVVNTDDLPEFLGPRRFFSEAAERTRQSGVAVGLAWTQVGGEILFIEATCMPGKGRLQLTGKLGDTMKESAHAAMSWIRANAADLGIEAGRFETLDLHLHIPAGAVPKDGPSAGVSILTALVSLLTDRPVKNRLAMTGEITLRGLVLPVGGVKEKVLAARRAGIKTVILPERNRCDLEEIPEDARAPMRFVFVREMAQVIQHAISKRRAPKKRKPILSALGSRFAASDRPGKA